MDPLLGIDPITDQVWAKTPCSSTPSTSSTPSSASGRLRRTRFMISLLALGHLVPLRAEVWPNYGIFSGHLLPKRICPKELLTSHGGSLTVLTAAIKPLPLLLLHHLSVHRPFIRAINALERPLPAQCLFGNGHISHGLKSSAKADVAVHRILRNDESIFPNWQKIGNKNLRPEHNSHFCLRPIDLSLSLLNFCCQDQSDKVFCWTISTAV